MSQIELFSLRPLLSFESLFTTNKNKDLFNIDNVDDFRILSWTAGGRYDGREFVVIACKSKAQLNANTNTGNASSNLVQSQQSLLSQASNYSATPSSPRSAEQSSQQYLIIRSVNALPQKLRSKYRRRSKRKHAKLVKDSNIQHLYGDIYHIDVDDDDDDDEDEDKDDTKADNDDSKQTDSKQPSNGNTTTNNSNKKNTEQKAQQKTNTSKRDYTEIDSDDDDSDGIHSVSSMDSEPPDIQHFGTNFAPEKEANINYSEYDELPVLRIITWFKTALSSSFDKTIVAMDFNPSGSWLMVTCRDCSVYLLPLRNFLEIPTHQLELAVTTAYELNNAGNNDDEFFEQQFGFVNQSNDIKRGGMIRSNSMSLLLDANGIPIENSNTNEVRQNAQDGDESDRYQKRKKKSKQGDVNNIGSTSLAHLVLHRSKSNKAKSKKSWGSSWFGTRKSSFSGANAPFSYRSMSGSSIRNGHDISEQLEDEVCADGNESFGAQHDLTILSHGIARIRGDDSNASLDGKSAKSSKKRKKSNKHLKHSLLNIDENKEVCANCSVWWTTRSRKDYVIFGTNDGRICLLNVRSHKKTWIEIGNEALNIMSLELIIDIKSSSVLIHCSNNIYYILLLERPYKKNRDPSQALGALNAQMSQELLMAGYLLTNPQNEDPSKITQWDSIIDNYQLPAFKPLQLNLGNEESTSRMSLSKKHRKDNNDDIKSTTTSSSNDMTVSVSVYHNTGSVIADPHQQTPTPSEKAARMLGLPYPRRRIVASNQKPFGGNGLSSSSLQNINEDPLRTEHAQSCVHFGVFYNKQSKLSLHALDEIYEPARASFAIPPSLANVFAHNFIISLAPNNQHNQVSIIAPPLASTMAPTDDFSELEDLDDEPSMMRLTANSEEEEEEVELDDEDATDEIHTVNDDDGDRGSVRTQDMLTSDEDDNGNKQQQQKSSNTNLRNINLKRALLRHQGLKNTSSAKMPNGGIVQNLILDPDEKVQAILDRTTSVIMSNPKIYIARLDPLELSQLNKDATNAFDVTITPTMGKSEIPYGATHSVWSSLRSPYLLLLTNKAVYQIDKQFDGFSTVLQAVEKVNHYGGDSRNVVNGLAVCCEVSSKAIHEIAADRMLAHNSKIRDAERSFELYQRSSVTVAKLIRQFLRPEWLHDVKHDIIVSKIFWILKQLLTKADIPSRITFSDIMFNLLLLQYHIHHPFLDYITSKQDTIQLLSYDTQQMLKQLPKEIFMENSPKKSVKDIAAKPADDDQEIIEMNSDEDEEKAEADDDREEEDKDDDEDEDEDESVIANEVDKQRESEAELRRRKLIHFISLNRECSLKTVIRKLLNISQQDLALHVLQSHDHPKSVGANANLPVGDGPAVQVAQAAALKQAQAGISLNVTGNLTDYFLSITSSLGMSLEPGTASFVIRNYPLLFLERKLDLKTIPSQFWTDIIFNMLDNVVQLCENSNAAQRYYQTQQLFRQRKQQQNIHEEYVKEADIEDAAKDAEKYGTKEIKAINQNDDNEDAQDGDDQNPKNTDNKKEKQATDINNDNRDRDEKNDNNEADGKSEEAADDESKPQLPAQPPSMMNKLPKSFQEETRMRQKQCVQYLADNIDLFSLKQLVDIHGYLSKLTGNILKKLYSSKSSGLGANADAAEDYDVLSWSTPGWLLLHLKVLLRIRYINRVHNDKWDKYGDDEYGKEFEYFLDEVLSKFTGMLDVTLILDEMLKCNDLPMAMLLHEKLSNYHDYIITYIRYLLQQSHGTIDHLNRMSAKNVPDCVLATDKEYRQSVLKKIASKLFLLKPSQNKILLGEEGAIAHAQGRCLARLIGLWMKLELPLQEIENVCMLNFDDVKYGLSNVLFQHWAQHQTWFDHDTVPAFSPRLMLRISRFALMTNKKI